MCLCGEYQVVSQFLFIENELGEVFDSYQVDILHACMGIRGV